MRYNGRIVEWNDVRGFGFVVVPGSETRHFLHIKSIAGRDRRPQAGDRISFELESGAGNRTRAIRVRYADSPARAASTGVKRTAGARNFALDWALALGLIVLLGWNVIAGHLPPWVLGAIAIGSLLAFVMYNIDKRRAERNARRTPEADLLAISVIGWPGALAAQRLFRHKSSKRAFYFVFRSIAMLEAGALLWLGQSSFFA